MKGKICIIGGGLAKGGQERGLTNLANYLSENGYDVAIICLFNTKIEFVLNSKIEILWPKADRDRMNRIVYALKLIPYIRNIIKKNKPNVVLSFGDWFNAYSIVATLRLKIPIYITNRMGPEVNQSFFFKIINSITYPHADGLIVQTERAKEIFLKKYKINKVYVVPNPAPVIREQDVVKKLRILSVGRLSREKGHDILIRAFALLNNKDWTLHFAGDGPLLGYLKSLTEELKINEQVFFHGKIDDIPSFLSQGKIFVLPSYYEGFPNALLEAMSYGLAVVSSDCIAGPAEIVNSGYNGFLFEPGNFKDLANKIKLFIDDELLLNEFSNRAKYVLVNFNHQKMLKVFEKILFSSKSSHLNK